MAVYRQKVKVLPGGRIQADFPELQAGEEVEIQVATTDQNSEKDCNQKETRRRPKGILAFLESMPPGPRSAATWEEVERNFQEERNSWDR